MRRSLVSTGGVITHAELC